MIKPCLQAMCRAAKCVRASPSHELRLNTLQSAIVTVTLLCRKAPVTGMPHSNTTTVATLPTHSRCTSTMPCTSNRVVRSPRLKRQPASVHLFARCTRTRSGRSVGLPGLRDVGDEMEQPYEWLEAVNAGDVEDHTVKDLRARCRCGWSGGANGHQRPLTHIGGHTKVTALVRACVCTWLHTDTWTLGRSCGR
jgi:hypothetical protein